MQHGISMAVGGLAMESKCITMAHGAGGKLSQELVEQVILPELSNPLLDVLHDGAIMQLSAGKLAFSTDSYVVRPRFFPGGNIGKLAVCGTVNDLAMTGAKPRYLSLGLILEEGLPWTELQEILHTVRLAAEEAGVAVVTGDTKVVEKGCCDGIFINTAGVGEILPQANINPQNIKPGMAVLVSGFIGDHAATILGARHGLSLPESIKSDCAPLNHLVEDMLTSYPEIAVLRDPTRGGLAATLNELAVQSNTGILLDQASLPVRPEVQGVCELLGFDPLYLANEGKLLAFVPEREATGLLKLMQQQKYGANASIIGRVTTEAPGQVGLETELGGIRMVDMPLGELVPRIC